VKSVHQALHRFGMSQSRVGSMVRLIAGSPGIARSVSGIQGGVRLKDIEQRGPSGSGASAKLACPLCGQGLWHTENGLAAHIWHDHTESNICMGHGRTSIKYGDPASDQCSRSVMALCAFRLARTSLQDGRGTNVFSSACNSAIRIRLSRY